MLMYWPTSRPKKVKLSLTSLHQMLLDQLVFLVLLTLHKNQRFHSVSTLSNTMCAIDTQKVRVHVQTTTRLKYFPTSKPPSSDAEPRPDFCFEGISSGVSSGKCYIRDCMKCHDLLLFDLACKSSPALMKAFKTYENTMSSKNRPTTKPKTKTRS